MRSRIQFKYFSEKLRNYFFLKNYIPSEGAISHNVLLYQQLSVARYQVTFFMLTTILSIISPCGREKGGEGGGVVVGGSDEEIDL